MREAEVFPLRVRPSRGGSKVAVRGSKAGRIVRIAWKPKRGKWVGLEIDIDQKTAQLHGRFKSADDLDHWIAINWLDLDLIG